MRAWFMVAVVLAMPALALADENETLTTPDGEPAGTILVSAAFRINSNSMTWYGSSGHRSIESETGYPGTELRAAYWLSPQLLLEGELGRPATDDRLGHAEDFHRDRARLLVRYELGRSAGRLAFATQVAGGLMVVTDKLTEGPPAVGIGGSAQVSLGNRRGKVLAYVTGGRPGTTGIHASAGASVTHGAVWFQSLTYWRGYSLKHGSVQGHQLWGLRAATGRRIGQRWSINVNVGVISWPRTFVLQAGVAGRPTLWSLGFGVQRRFGSTHQDAALRGTNSEDPWDAIRRGTGSPRRQPLGSLGQLDVDAFCAR